jgi:hypothetical protein
MKGVRYPLPTAGSIFGQVSADTFQMASTSCVICCEALPVWRDPHSPIAATTDCGTTDRGTQRTSEAAIIGKLAGDESACGHSQFCFDCVDHWAAIATFCPLCKAPFSVIEKWRVVRPHRHLVRLLCKRQLAGWPCLNACRDLVGHLCLCQRSPCPPNYKQFKTMI